MLTLLVLDKEGKIIAQRSQEGFVDLVCEREYEEGDRIAILSTEKDIYIKLQVDDALGESMVYLTDKKADYVIPFGEKRVSMSPRVFTGSKHYMYVEKVLEEEIYAYRNLALNQNDQHRDVPLYPHATANVETRGESVFAARNAIDGVRASLCHGEWPYESWGINRQDDAKIRIDFGRPVEIDRIVLYTRSDFPHDNWWVRGTIFFSDGSRETLEMDKQIQGHVFNIGRREVTWLELGDLIKADDPSPFPALTQIEVYGRNVRKHSN